MTRWILDFISTTGYFGIVVLMFFENIFPPIPSEFIMPLAGFLYLIRVVRYKKPQTSE